MHTILLVEKDRTRRDACATLLKRSGYRVQTANRAIEAILWMRRDEPDLVLLNPETRGAGQLIILMKLWEYSDIPLVLYTDTRMLDQSDLDEFADAVVLKDAPFRMLQCALSDLLEDKPTVLPLHAVAS